ncbi:MAG TPA: choice-of-anchor Q domain-containing protein, partial [Vicinamibacterales bacterium]|nr:choice-of-anchor Q domain-containing protein [Vicinamibacterales bacterium]
MKTLSPSRSARRVPLAACLCLALCIPAEVASAGVLDHIPGRLLADAWRANPGGRPGAARARIAREAIGSSRPATTLPVTSCADDGSDGTLRAVVASAATGDIVDMSQLTCGTITLTTGQINIYVDNLTLQGPGQTALTIDANHASRAIAGYGRGLAINDLTVANGYQTGPGYGGCVYSYLYQPDNPTTLARVTVDGCTAVASGGASFAVGGGVLAFGSLTLESSTLSNNTATGPDGTQILGGGAYVAYGFDITNSTITGNRAVRSAPGSNRFALGGGIDASIRDSQSALTGSTLSDNTADDFGGALFLYVASIGGSTISMHVANSTVSGNTSGSGTGIEIDSGPNAPFYLALDNSTVAFNAFTRDTGCGGLAQAGYTSSVVDLESTILAGNTGPGGAEYDACASQDTSSLTGANNLRVVSELPVPPGTLSDDPMLGPLQDNGGPTRTHALLPGSPAIDNGNNVAALDFDQRGAGFAREVGARADIGAFEVQA